MKEAKAKLFANVSQELWDISCIVVIAWYSYILLHNRKLIGSQYLITSKVQVGLHYSNAAESQINLILLLVPLSYSNYNPRRAQTFSMCLLEWQFVFKLCTRAPGVYSTCSRKWTRGRRTYWSAYFLTSEDWTKQYIPSSSRTVCRHERCWNLLCPGGLFFLYRLMARGLLDQTPRGQCWSCW